MRQKLKFLGKDKRWLDPANIQHTVSRLRSPSWMWTSRVSLFHIEGIFPRKRGWNKYESTILGQMGDQSINMDTVKKGDILCIAATLERHSNWRRSRNPTYRQSFNGEFFIIIDITLDWMEIGAVEEVAVIKFFKKQNATTGAVVSAISIDPKKLEEHYSSFSTLSDPTDRISQLTLAVGWMDDALRLTIARNKLPPNAPKTYKTVKKMKMRAVHSTTVDHEKETCLRMVLKKMEGIVDPTLLPPSGIGEAIALFDQNKFSNSLRGTLINKDRDKPKATTQNTPRRSSAPVTDHPLMKIADIFVQTLGDGAWAKPGASRATIFWPDYHKTQNFVTLTGSLRKMRVYSPFMKLELGAELDPKKQAFFSFKNPTPNNPDIGTIASYLKEQYEKGATPWDP